MLYCILDYLVGTLTWMRLCFRKVQISSVNLYVAIVAIGIFVFTLAQRGQGCSLVKFGFENIEDLVDICVVICNCFSRNHL